MINVDLGKLVGNTVIITIVGVTVTHYLICKNAELKQEVKRLKNENRELQNEIDILDATVNTVD